MRGDLLVSRIRGYFKHYDHYKIARDKWDIRVEYNMKPLRKVGYTKGIFELRIDGIPMFASGAILGVGVEGDQLQLLTKREVPCVFRIWKPSCIRSIMFSQEDLDEWFITAIDIKVRQWKRSTPEQFVTRREW